MLNKLDGMEISSVTPTLKTLGEKVKQAVKYRGLTIHTMAIEKEHMNVERYEKGPTTLEHRSSFPQKKNFKRCE